MQDKLKFTRIKKDPPSKERITVRISKDCYEKIEEIALETGLSMKRVADKMIDFAYEHVELTEESEE